MMKQQFDIKKEFPNYFEMIVKQIKSTGNRPDVDAVSRVENLLSANMSALLNRLNLAYIDVSQKPTNQHFYEELFKKMQQIKTTKY